MVARNGSAAASTKAPRRLKLIGWYLTPQPADEPPRRARNPADPGGDLAYPSIGRIPDEHDREGQLGHEQSGITLTCTHAAFGRDVATRERLVARARHLVGAADDLTAFYAAARGEQAFAPILGLLHGLHHVRFLTLEEIAVYCVFMQRTPITQAAALKRRFLAAFGKPGLAGDHELRAMPEMHELGALTTGEVAQAIGHGRKAEHVVSVVRGGAALGEELLATAPYTAARDALLAIAGVGPFSAGAILLRGLGRMDELPGLEMIAGDAARSVHGPRFDPDAIVARYGRTIGYWSFYLKTGAARLTPSSRATPATRAHGRASRSRTGAGNSAGEHPRTAS